MARSDLPHDLERLLLRRTHALRAADRFGPPGRTRRLSVEDHGEVRGLICDLHDIVDRLARHLDATGRQMDDALRGHSASLAYLTVGRAVTPPKRRHDA
jgi:hypothetical protein